jgi:hypothetical protein
MEVQAMSDIVERQREIVARHIRVENEHDWASVYDIFVQDDRAHYDVVPLSAVFKGIEEMWPGRSPLKELGAIGDGSRQVGFCLSGCLSSLP